MELFTLLKEINLQLGGPDFVRQTFTMEAFTLWSPTFSLDSTLMEAPSPMGEPHLRLETFTLCPHAMVHSFACFPQVGVAAPCTNSVYKAAHRSIRLATVSPPQIRLWTIANKPHFVFPSLFCLSPVFLNRQVCDFQVRGSPTPKPRQRMTTQGFSSKGLNKLAHALNGNYVSRIIPTPHYRSKEWRHSFSIPTGMIVFRYAFYGKFKLWLTYYRRGQSYEIETSRPESPRLYGTMLRSVASCGGGPGSRWTYFRKFRPYWPHPSSIMVSQGNAQHIYDWNHLRYEGSGPDDIYVSDVDDDYDDAGPDQWDQSGNLGVPCGYQDRRALRGSHRGSRSEASRTRRFTSWKQHQRGSRQDFRTPCGHTVIRIRSP